MAVAAADCLLAVTLLLLLLLCLASAVHCCCGLLCVQISKYRRVAQRLAQLLQHSLASSFRAWREATDAARVRWRRAERHAAAKLMARVLPEWAALAASMQQWRSGAEAAAARRHRRAVCRALLRGWAAVAEHGRQQRALLWRVVLLVAQHEACEALAAALQGWREHAAQQAALRSCVAAFVNRRRLACLSEHLTLWSQYAAAMRASGAPLIAASPAAAAAAMQSAPVSPAGLLPVTGGSASPLLGPRSAHQDRHLARRMVALAGGAAEVWHARPCS